MRNLLALAFLLVACGRQASKPTTPEVVVDRERAAPVLLDEARPGTPLPAGSRSARIYFAYDAALVDEAARDALVTLAKALGSDPAARVAIGGHTDERGTVEYNVALGDERARAARDYLVRLGVDGSRVRATSFGESEPAVEGAGEAAWAQNRRDELEVTHASR